jgi:tyrosine-protein phosphatase SIW14
MARNWRVALGVVVFALVVAVPLLYSAHQRTHLRNLRVVEAGKLYRSGQLSPTGFEQVLAEYRIKTVISLRTSRDPAVPFPDGWEKDVCDVRGLNHLRLIPQVWGADEKGEIPAEANVQKFLAAMDDPANHPVLVHCYAGIHRTGTMCAVYRMEYNGWPVDRAIAEMQEYGFDPEDMHEHIEGYLRNYERRAHRGAAAPPVEEKEPTR